MKIWMGGSVDSRSQAELAPGVLQGGYCLIVFSRVRTTFNHEPIDAHGALADPLIGRIRTLLVVQLAIRKNQLKCSHRTSSFKKYLARMNRIAAMDRARREKGLDPLGMQNTASFISRFAAGHQQRTLRIRYYGFYCWLSDAYAHHEAAPTLKTAALVRRRSALCWFRSAAGVKAE